MSSEIILVVRLWTNISETNLYVTVSTTLVTVSYLLSLIDASPLLLSGAVTGVMGSIIGKLAALLGEKYQLTRDVERGICFLKDELSTMDAVL